MIGLRRLWVVLKFLGALALVFLMLVWPEEALGSAQRAMRVWAYSVGPSLFPFMMLLPTLTCSVARQGYEKLLGRLMRPLFRLPGKSAAAMFVGMLAGSPAGAVAAARVGHGMSKGEFKRMALMTTGVSPVFLLSGVGVALFGSQEFGLWLVIGQVSAQLLTGFILRGCFSSESELVESTVDDAQEKPIRVAVMSILQVCGYMVLFSVIAGLAAKLVGGYAGDAILYILDMPSGVAQAAENGASWVLAAAIVGFGGLCIGTQNMGVLAPLGVRWHEYLATRVFSAGVCAGCVAVRFQLTGVAAPTMAVVGEMYTMEFSTLAALLLLLPALFAFARKQTNS